MPFCLGGMCGLRKKKSLRHVSTSDDYANQMETESIEESALPHIKTVKELHHVARFASDKLVVLDFYATWCQPCQKIGPILEYWVDEYPDVLFVKVNVDHCDHHLLAEFNIKSVPTFVFMKKQKMIAVFNGGQFPALKKLVEEHRFTGVEIPAAPSPSLLRDGIHPEAIPAKSKTGNEKGSKSTSSTTTPISSQGPSSSRSKKTPTLPLVVDASKTSRAANKSGRGGPSADSDGN